MRQRDISKPLLVFKKAWYEQKTNDSTLVSIYLGSLWLGHIINQF